MKKLLFVVVVGALSVATFSSSDKDLEVDSKVLMRTNLGDGKSRVKRQAISMTQRLRIFPQYQDNFDNSLQQNASFIRNNVIPELLEFVENSLMVAPLSEPILLNHNCTTSERVYFRRSSRYQCVAQCQPQTYCGPFLLPTEHLAGCYECNAASLESVILTQCTRNPVDGAGVTGHEFVLYITADQSSCSENEESIAFGSSCAMEAMQDRPIAGFINFCPDRVRQAMQDHVSIVTKRALFRILGISRRSFSYWRDPTDNSARTLRDTDGFPNVLSDGNLEIASNTIERTTMNWTTAAGSISREIARLVTPAIRREAQRHFNCSSLMGVEMETQGGQQTELEYFEKRVLGNEAMTAALTFNPVFSNFTFAALEDSGWYSVNYSNAEELIWGRNAGCRFAEGSCGEWIQTQTSSDQSPSPFCGTDSFGMASCTIDREAVSMCNNFSFDSIPPEFQYFSDAQVGGRVVYADYCPFQDAIRSCYSSSDMPNGNPFLENYRRGSRCVNHGQRQWTVNGQPQAMSGGGCYQYSCTDTAVTITVGSENIVCSCSQAGQEMMVNQGNYQGSILCPSCTQLCYQPSLYISAKRNPEDDTTQPIPGDTTQSMQPEGDTTQSMQPVGGTTQSMIAGTAQPTTSNNKGDSLQTCRESALLILLLSLFLAITLYV